MIKVWRGTGILLIDGVMTVIRRSITQQESGDNAALFLFCQFPQRISYYITEVTNYMIKSMEIPFAALGDHLDKKLTIEHEAYYYEGGLVNLDADNVYLEVYGGRIEAVPVEIVKESKLTTLVEGA